MIIGSSCCSMMVVVFGLLDKRTNEIGPGGRGSDAGAKVCVFGAGRILGRYVCYNLGGYS